MDKPVLAVVDGKNSPGGDACLEDRIADAFGAELTSSQLSVLLAEVAKADEQAEADAERANEIALDPATRPEAVASARRDAEDANFRRLRMERATSRLTEMRAEAAKREQEKRRMDERSAAVAERDQIVKDLAEYEEHASKIAALMERLKASNDRLEKLGEWIDRAEPIARGAGQEILIRPDSRLPVLVADVRLPKFRRDDTVHGYLWPSDPRN